MGRNWRLVALLLTGISAAACGASGTAATPGATARTTAPAAGDVIGAAQSSSPGSPPAASARPGAPARPRPLAGRTVGIDPGHNGRNKDDPAFLNQLIWNGRASETCDTTGTETDGGYTEAQFNFRVATFLGADLRALGARVVLTRHSNHGVGPCVDRRSQIINRAHASVAIDIHADGGPAWGRGFTILEPVADGPNNQVIGSSIRLGRDVKTAMLKYTRMPVSNYYGQGGVIFRNDLAGLNLATQPKILIETGNMRNPADARLLVRTWFQKRLARVLTAAIVWFLTRR